MTEPSQYFKGRTVQEQMNEVIGYVDTRASEVATNAIAADVAQVHQDKLDADADASAAAASAAAAAGTLANAVKKTGEASQSIAGDIAVAGNLTGGVVTGTVITVPTPVNNTDAANKKYVDDADALKLSITDVNTYAVGLTGSQNVSGIKRFLNSFYYAQRVVGRNAYELCRITGTSTARFIATIISRYGSCEAEVIVTTDGTSVTSITVNKVVIAATGIYATTVYAYIEDGSIVICVGNDINANNYIGIDFKGAFADGDGTYLNLDITNCGTARSTTGVVKKVVFA